MNLRTAVWTLPISLLLAACDPSSDTPADTEGSETGAGDGDGDAGDGDGDSGDGDGDGDSGDGDGDSGDGDGDSGDGDGDGDDPIATAACEAIVNGTPQMLIAAATAGEAATAPVVSDGQTLYMITLPMDAPGFIELQIPEWETTQAFFTVQDIDYTITTMANAQQPGPREPLLACGELGITDQRVFFPHWTPATIEFGATGPREIPLMIIQE